MSLSDLVELMTFSRNFLLIGANAKLGGGAGMKLTGRATLLDAEGSLLSSSREGTFKVRLLPKSTAIAINPITMMIKTKPITAPMIIMMLSPFSSYGDFYDRS